MSKGIVRKDLDGKGLKIGIVTTRWNEEIILNLQTRCMKALLDAGVDAGDIIQVEGSGSYELPFAAKQLILKQEVDVVIPLGCLIKGETMHFEYIAEAVSQGFMQVQLETGIPVLFGVLTCFTEEQALERAKEDGKDHGYEWGQAAVEMARLNKSLV